MTILGLDLSTRAAAIVSVPQNWGGDWDSVSSLVVGIDLDKQASDNDRARRTGEIARALVDFARKRRATVAWIESYAFGMNLMAHTLGELGGVVRLELLRAGIELRTANMSSARKTLLGKLPPRRKEGEPATKSERIELCGRTVTVKGAPKIVVVKALKAAGAEFGTVDEYEAFVCANFGLSQVGAFFYGQVGP